MIGVLIVDDSVVIRRMLAAVLDEDPELEVVGTAANGRIALDKLPQLRPDAVVLDVEMPVLDGLATLRELRRTHPRLPVIMFSTVTERGAQATLDALAAGASDYVTKPSKVSSVAASIARVRDDLIPKIKALVAARRGEARPTSADVRLAPAPPAAPGMVEALAIGCSTGGPDALASVVAHLPADLGVPVFVVQHMPPLFTKLFAERLDRNCPMQVREAVDGEPAVAGRIYVARATPTWSCAGGPDRSSSTSPRNPRRTTAVPRWTCCSARSLPCTVHGRLPASSPGWAATA